MRLEKSTKDITSKLYYESPISYFLLPLQPSSQLLKRLLSLTLRCCFSLISMACYKLRDFRQLTCTYLDIEEHIFPGAYLKRPSAYSKNISVHSPSDSGF